MAVKAGKRELIDSGADKRFIKQDKEGRHSRRSFVSRLGLFCCALPVTAVAQQVRPHRVRRIGFLSGAVPTLIKAFEDELRTLGYVDGHNLIIERRISRPNSSDLAVQAAELAGMDLELILAAALPQALEIRKNNPAMPMVIATCPGMVSNGFAKTLNRPGGHYTGMDELPPGVTAKRLRLLKTAAPSVSRVALLSTTPGTGGHEAQLADAVKTAKSLRLLVKPYRASSLNELETALAAIVDDGMDGLANFQGGLSLANRQLIVDFAAKNRLPAIYQAMFFVEAGGLMAWAPNQEEQYRQAARYINLILKGAKPGDLPVHYPSRYYLTINKSAAQRISLVLPPKLIGQADRVLP
jgi:putative tryptophan/tyrosine transport system substrate-binding protein